MLKELRRQTSIGHETIQDDTEYRIGEEVNLTVTANVQEIDADAYQLELTPLESVQHQDLEKHQNVTFQLHAIGAYKLTLTDGTPNGISKDLVSNFSLQCKADHKQRGVGCRLRQSCPANSDKVLTGGNVCVDPIIQASVASKELRVLLNKVNPTLNLTAPATSNVIQVGPSADFTLKLQPPKLVQNTKYSQSVPHWVKLADYKSWVNTTDHAYEIPVFFNTSGIADLSDLSATAIFTGKATDTERVVTAQNDNLRVLASVISTSSLEKSKFEMPNEVPEGQTATVSIQAFDDDNMPITEGRARFFELKLRRPNGNEDTRAVPFWAREKRFALDLTRSDLSDVGLYHLWVHTAFGFPVSATNKQLALPTEGFPRTLTVTPKTEVRLQVVIGTTIGTALALCWSVTFLFA